MTHLILKIYDFMRTHIHLCVGSFCAITITLLCLILRLDFKEDISAFLKSNQKIKQGANRRYELISLLQNFDRKKNRGRSYGGQRTGRD